MCQLRLNTSLLLFQPTNGRSTFPYSIMTNYINPKDTIDIKKLIFVMKRISEDSDDVAGEVLQIAANHLESLQKENEELKRAYVKNDYFNPLPL